MLSPVRLSVTLVRQTQAVGIVGNISMAFGTLAICSKAQKFYGDHPREPLHRGVKPKRGSKI